MKNFEKWLQDIKKNGKDVPLACSKCPAALFCEDYPYEEHECADIFIEWAESEVEDE